MSRSPETARRLFDRFEPVHAVTYFAPEAGEALSSTFGGFWNGYFAARSAPLGTVPVDVVIATFYNFSPAHVRRSLPKVWEAGSPGDALRLREATSAAALRRYGVTNDEATTAAALLERAARTAPVEGRPLFAANLALPWPDDPVARLWHATTLLREQRGDGHVAVLVNTGLTGRECNVLHSLADRVPREFIMLSRRYDDAEWLACTEALADRGVIDAHGRLTPAGARLKTDIEQSTDRLALAAFADLDDDDLDTLFRTLTPLARKVVAAGDIPAATPMGLQRDDLDDESAGVR